MAHEPLAQTGVAWGKEHALHAAAAQPWLGSVCETHVPVHVFCPVGQAAASRASTLASAASAGFVPPSEASGDE